MSLSAEDITVTSPGLTVRGLVAVALTIADVTSPGLTVRNRLTSRLEG